MITMPVWLFIIVLIVALIYIVTFSYMFYHLGKSDKTSELITKFLLKMRDDND